MKHILLNSLVSLMVVTLLVSVVYAAPPTPLWSDEVSTNDIDLSKDGNYVAIVRPVPFTDSEVRFYSRSSRIPIWTKTISGEILYSAAISADGDCVVAGGDPHVYFWKNARSLTGNPSPTWTSVPLHGPVERRCLDISDDGNYVVACGTGRWVFYWANAKGLSGSDKPVTWQSRIFDNVMSVDLSSDGNYVAATIENGITLSSLIYWKNARTLTGTNLNPDWISSKVSDKLIDVAISDDGNYIASAGTGWPSPVYYWANAKTLSGNPSATWMGAPGVDFFSVDISSDGGSVVAGAVGPSFGVYFWVGAKTLAGTVNPRWIYSTDGPVYDVAISDAGDYIAAVNNVASHYAYFLNDVGNLLWRYQFNDMVDKVSMSGDGATLAVGTATELTGYLFSTGYSSVPRPVGGVVIPVNKLEILTPYLALAGLVAAISAVVVVKRRRD